MDLLNNLYKIRHLEKIIASKFRQKEKLAYQKNLIKSTDYEKDRVQSCNKKGFTDVVDRLVDLEKEIDSVIDELTEFRSRVEKEVREKLQGAEYMTIEMYYFEGLTIYEISKKTKYSERQIFRFKHSAESKLKENGSKCHTKL